MGNQCCKPVQITQNEFRINIGIIQKNDLQQQSSQNLHEKDQKVGLSMKSQEKMSFDSIGSIEEKNREKVTFQLCAPDKQTNKRKKRAQTHKLKLLEQRGYTINLEAINLSSHSQEMQKDQDCEDPAEKKQLKIDQNDDLLVEEKINHQENEELQKIINYLLSEETYYKLLAGQPINMIIKSQSIMNIQQQIKIALQISQTIFDQVNYIDQYIQNENVYQVIDNIPRIIENSLFEALNTNVHIEKDVQILLDDVLSSLVESYQYIKLQKEKEILFFDKWWGKDKSQEDYQKELISNVQEKLKRFSSKVMSLLKIKENNNKN